MTRIESVEVVDLLLECHERIRRFLAAARAVGERADVPDGEVVETCLRIERYFSEAFPLHVADEEQSVAPRLAGRSAALDDALRAMGEEHGSHQELLGVLLDAVDAVRTGPADAKAREALAQAAAALADALEDHLAMEEGVIFPAARELDEQDQVEILGEIRGRRRGPVDLDASTVRRYRSVT